MPLNDEETRLFDNSVKVLKDIQAPFEKSLRNDVTDNIIMKSSG